MELYHYTCEHGHDGIQRTGTVLPKLQPLLGIRLAWFTDLDEPDRDAVGLTSNLISCDRLAYRFEVDASVPRKWLGSTEQSQTPPQLQADLHRLGQPEHWWISQRPVRVVAP